MDSNSSGGISFSALLGLLFIGLKLGNVIDWSWFWVLSPFWIPLALVLVVAALLILAATGRAILKSFS